MTERILVIEDETAALRALSCLLSDEGYKVFEAPYGQIGLTLAREQLPDLVLLDIRLPDVNGLEVLGRLRQEHCDAAVLIMTADTTSSNAIQATRLGAFDYIAKPINDEHLLVLIRRALDYRELEREVRDLRSAAPQQPLSTFVGHSPAMQEVYKIIGRVAASDITALLFGESCTGKELAADAIHAFSERSKGPLVKVNCAAIPDSLLEEELFGHEKGAFTNAVVRRIGRFEEADKGTIFLDEIGDLSPALQVKLLRVIQEKTIERLGNNTPIRVDFRLIAATAQDLPAMVKTGRFREDLYYRLNVVTIPLPPLRERREDIPFLVQRFLARSERPVTIRQDALERILAHDWPGNVRELENVVARAMVLAPGGVITPECIQFARGRRDSSTAWLDQIPHHEGYWTILKQVEGQLIRAALAEAHGNKAEAARILGVRRRLLYEKLSELGMEC
jgi:two-component system, NtrC family, response regulator AtoC